MKIRKEVKSYEVRYFCDDCPLEELKFMGNNDSDFDSMNYPHKCSLCDRIYYLDRQYPTVEHEEVT